MSVNPIPALADTAQGSGGVDLVRSENANEATQGKTQPQPSAATTQAANDKDQVELSSHPSTLPAAAQYALAYHFDDRTHRFYFQVVDETSGEVILQVPPQDVLDYQARLAEYLEIRVKSSEKPTGKTEEGG